MTELADDAAALSVNPMVMGNESGIYTHVDHHGLTPAGEELADFIGERCKPAVETGHHKRSTASLQLLSIAVLQCLGCQGCMGVMTRQDEYSIDIGVMQQFRGLYRGLKLEGALRRSSAR